MPGHRGSDEGDFMILQGRTISRGKASGEVLKLEEPLSFLGGVDGATGDLRVEKEGNVAGRILVFPRGKGRTVGSFVMYDLMVHGNAPAAVINTSAETIVATGAVISSIPMIDSVDVDLIHDGDHVTIDADDGTVEIDGVTMIECASSVLMIGDRFVMLHRPSTSRSYPGRWSLVSGKMEVGESPVDTARREILEETGIAVGDASGSIEALIVREGDIIWKVHPFIFTVPEGMVPRINSENTEYRLCSIDDLDGMELVPLTKDAVIRLIGMI